MNTKLWIGATAFGLLAVSVAFRSGREEARRDGASHASKTAAPGAGVIAPVLPITDGKAYSMATALRDRLERVQAMENERRALEFPYTEEERSRLEVLKSESRELAEQLAARLRIRPDEWEDVFAVWGFGSGLKTSTFALDMLHDAGAAEGDQLPVKVLQDGSTSRVRQLAARVLRGGSSPESLFALVAAAKGDESPQVRMDAMRSLMRRRGQGESENERLLIAETLRGRAHADPDAGIRQFAARLNLDSAKETSTAQARPATSRPLIRQVKTNWAESDIGSQTPR